MDPQQRARLLAATLQSLVETTAGPGDRRSLAFPGGAALAGDDGTWVLSDAEPARALGPALAVARQATGSLEHVHVLARESTGLLARRAGEFASPPTIHRIDGARLVVAEAEPRTPDAPLDPRLAAFADQIVAAGADPVVEHGRLVGEVAGLEVCRVEIVDDAPRLSVGVGRFDREANELLGSDSLERVVELVHQRRVVDRDPNPLKRWAGGRLLRSAVLHEPSLVGADHLAPMSPTVEAPDLRVSWPAPATGLDTAGAPIVVVCSVGVDLDLVPAAAEARLADGRDARLVIAVPPRDVHPVTAALAAALRHPAEVIAVPI